MTISTGRNFLHTPGPTNIPDRVLRAMAQPAVDFSTPEFLEMMRSLYADLKRVFRTESSEVVMYASNGHGAWEAALVNALSPGDHVLVPGAGHFSINWAEMAEAFGIVVETLPGDWRHGIDTAAVSAHLKADTDHKIKAVLTVHIDTATSLICDLPAMRKAIDDAGHPALFMVDTVAALGSVDFRMDEWGIDVAVGGSQKGLMQPPGLAFNAVSQKALDASDNATLPRLYWDWKRRMDDAYYKWFCGTPARAPAVCAAGRARHGFRRRTRECLCPPRPVGGSGAPLRQCLGTGQLHFAECGRSARSGEFRDDNPG